MSTKQELLKHVSAAISEVQHCIDKLGALHALAVDTDVYKQLVVQRTHLREILMKLNKVNIK